MQKPTRAALIAAAAGALATLPGLWSGTLWDNSETTYGEVAREIVLRGDWIVMHQNNAPWFVQPPLYFWIGALFIKVLGLNAFALRLPSAVATIAMAAATAYAVVRSGGERAAAYAGIVLSTCLLQAVLGRLAVMDALLDLCVTLAILWWYRALETGRGGYAVAGCVACAFGTLAKG
ncbi:MAG: ArnT family glycosyltransferase, partial [Candidatus Baltobacteraceae bacterium]